MMRLSARRSDGGRSDSCEPPGFQPHSAGSSDRHGDALNINEALPGNNAEAIRIARVQLEGYHYHYSY